MQFANPAILWGLLALSIPLIIHLFNFRRSRKVLFSNVALLKKVETETSAFRKVKQWLIMAARMLFLACLVLAFAQPFFAAKDGGHSVKGMNSLYLDNSLSMQNITDGKRYIDLAVLKIDELLSLFKNQQNVQFLTNNFSEEDQFIQGAAKIKERLAEIDFSSRHRTLTQIFRRQKSLAEKAGSTLNNKFFWFSDFQKSTVGDLATLQPDSTQHVYLVPVQGAGLRNVFVDSVWMASPFVREMQNTVLYVKVFNSGNEAVENMPLKLFIDDVQTSTSAATVAPNSFAIASFNFTVKQKGVHRGIIRFDDQPIMFDNESHFVLNIAPPVRILHLFQEKSANNYCSKVFANDSLFHFTQSSALNINPGRLTEQDFVILEGVAGFDDNLKNALSTFIRAGGSVLCVPPAKPKAENYNSFLAMLRAGSLYLAADSVSEGKRIALQEPDKVNPFFADVFEYSTQQILTNLPLIQLTADWSGTGERLLSLKNGRTFLSKTQIDAGRFYFLGAPLNASYGNFAEHALFVPTLFKMAVLSVKSQRLAYNFSEGNIAIPFANAPKNAIYKLKSAKTEMIPIQRTVGGQLILELPDATDLGNEVESGFYDLMIDNKKHLTLAINHNSLESKLEQYSPSELRELFKGKPNVTVFDNLLDNDFIDSFQAGNVGKSLWKYFLIAALLFLLAEILLIRFWKG